MLEILRQDFKKFKPFIINNDIKNLVWDLHNAFHVIGNAFMFLILTVFFSFSMFSGYLLTYFIWVLWEIGDGFKPSYLEFKPAPGYSKAFNWMRENFLYSNDFSLQDFLIWNPFGLILGVILYLIYTLIFI